MTWVILAQYDEVNHGAKFSDTGAGECGHALIFWGRETWGGRNSVRRLRELKRTRSKRSACNYSIRWSVIQEVFDNVEFDVESKSASPGAEMDLDGAAVRL